MRFNKIVPALLALTLVTACSSTKVDSTGGAKTSGALTNGQDQAQGGWKDDVVKSSEAKAATPGSQEELVVSIGDKTYFDVDKSDLNPEARNILDKQAKWLKMYPHLKVVIEGHCDERGTREYNLALGERRANSVKNYLAAAGVDPERIETVSYGKERPEALGSDEAAWAKNRRSVTVVN